MAITDAWTVCQGVYFPALEIGDAIITSCNAAAVDLYGFESPEKLIGQFLSDLTAPEHRRIGRWRWTAREMGIAIPDDYPSLIITPEGREVWHRRAFSRKLVGFGKSDIFITCLDEVGQPDPPDSREPLPERYGISEQDVIDHMGRYTVHEMSELIASRNLLEIPESFSTIVIDYGGLSRLLSLAFFGKVSFSIETGKIKFRKNCNRCAYIWHAWVDAERPQCPECKGQIKAVS